ncbi:MAG: sigma-54 dependent transcriptional regulator [Nitrospirota bacterium]|nr:sigma-54 dependent transcriptional regulator [Nitrospirota bacterium]MDP2384159.1 sigma-54 dependent transcriptional regulator [Nitrospirota bacterium]
MYSTIDKTFTILLVEDNGGDVEMFLRTVEEELPRKDDERVELVIAARAEGGLQILNERRIDLVISDVRLPGMSGLELLQRVQAMDRRIPVIMISWVDTVDIGVEAMRCGAFDYITKPFEKLDLAARIHRAMRISEMLYRYEPGQTGDALPFKELVGVSPAFRALTTMIEAAASVHTTTLIIGETGTGKELIARAIHDRSAERNGPFQVIDCTTFSEGTVDSELFGHVRGAFTGAVGDKLGLLEQGVGGTLFLDEIGDLPLPLQAKLLRVLEEGEVRAVGSVQLKKFRARFIAATNQELIEKVKRNEFRKDLFFRLNVMAIKVPPLRERTEDIPLLARHFIRRYAKEFGKPIADLHPSAATELVAYCWLGNVRELRNVMERAVMLAKGDRIGYHDVVGLLQFTDQAQRPESDDYLSLPYAKAKEKVLEDFSRRYIKRKLDRHQGNVTHASLEAGLPRSYFHEIMRRYLKDEK